MNENLYSIKNEYEAICNENESLKDEIAMLQLELSIIKQYNIEMIKQIVLDSD